MALSAILAERSRPGNRHPAPHSSLAPERLMTSAHLAESVLIVATKSSGVPPPGSSPIISNFCLNASDLSTLLIAALSLSTIGRGTPAGAITPVQVGAR